MDAGLILFVVLVMIAILAVIGLMALQRVEQWRADAYSTRQKANADVLTVIARLPNSQHHVTISRDAVMHIAPAPVSESHSQLEPPVTSDSVRYIVDALHPDSQARRDLLVIVNHSIIKTGDCGLIRSSNKCKDDGLIDPTRWQAAINYGAENYGVIAKPRENTTVGAYSKLSRLADAINKHQTVSPTPDETV